MNGYSAREVAKLLELSVGQVRSYARAGLLDAGRGPRGEYRFSFQDLVLLRAAKGLLASRIPPRRVRRALDRLKQQLPTGRPLSGVQIVARGDRVLVRNGDAVWNAESGQGQFDFDVAELARKARPHARQAARRALEEAAGFDAKQWQELGAELEAVAGDEARDAYRRALELDPYLVQARVNLGRLLHEAGRLDAAREHYRLALSVAPHDVTALFNLGVALEDLGLEDAAVTAYRDAIQSDPRCADAHFNLARLLERRGDSRSALRYLSAYRRLTDDS